MKKAIGLAWPVPINNSLANALMVMSRAYQVPVYHYYPTLLDPALANPTVPAKFWNGSAFETEEIEIPIITDGFFFSKRARQEGFLGAAKYDWIMDNTTVTDRGGITKHRLPEVLLKTSLAEFMIPTYQPSSYEHLHTLMTFFSRAITKPSGGRQGMGVRRLDCQQGALVYSTADATEILNQEAWDAYCADLQAQRLGTPLLQPRLNFTLDAQHAVDFRLLVARGGTGDWETVDIYARIGSSNLVSNVSQGGYICDALEALEIIVGDKAPSLMEVLETIARTLPPILQTYQKRPLTCLGIDVGIDRDTLQPYILEANTSPGTKYHTWQLAEKKVQYYKYLLSQA